MSNAVGPVCHIPPLSTPGDPQPTNIPGIPGPMSPNDPVATANLLNALRLALLGLLNQLNNLNNQVGTITSPKPAKQAQWTEQSRVTTTVRIFQNNDPSSSNWVDVEQINKLTMQDKTTGNTWVWSRGNG